MPEENEETKEAQETQENPNEVSTPENLEAIKAQLEEEKKAKAVAEASLAEKDARIAELEQVKESYGQAVAKYLGAVGGLGLLFARGLCP